jgi:hypothetical protein
MDPRFRDTYYQARRNSDTFKAVKTSFTTTGLATIWTPASGKKFVLKGGNLLATVSTVLATATPGAQIVLCDNAMATAVIQPIGVVSLAAQSIGSPLNVFYPVATAGSAPVASGFQPVSFLIPEGYQSATANNVLKCGTHDGSTIGSGVIQITGVVWGTEV